MYHSMPLADLLMNYFSRTLLLVRSLPPEPIINAGSRGPQPHVETTLPGSTRGLSCAPEVWSGYPFAFCRRFSICANSVRNSSGRRSPN